MPNLVHALRPGVLTGHNVPAQIDSDGVGAVHPAFLAEGVDRSLALNRRIESVDALSEAKGVRILDQRLEDRTRQAVQLRRLYPPRPDGSRGIITFTTPSSPTKMSGPTFSANQALSARRS